MIEYTAEYDEDVKPFLCKKITLGGEVIRTEISIHNKTELDNLTDEVIYEHLNNLVLYMKNDLSPQLEVTPYRQALTSPWPLIKWHELSHINDEISEWHQFVYYRTEVIFEEDYVEPTEPVEPTEETPE
jgi:hypothetical protein